MGAATGNVATGDRVFLGEQASYEEANLYTVGLVSASGFYVTPPNRKSLPFGSTLYSSSSYGLWDATENQALSYDTSCGVASGFLTLTHTDQVTGEKVTSTKVQAMPQLSSTVKVGTPAA